jgi:hypothetical protein
MGWWSAWAIDAVRRAGLAAASGDQPDGGGEADPVRTGVCLDRLAQVTVSAMS